MVSCLLRMYRSAPPTKLPATVNCTLSTDAFLIVHCLKYRIFSTSGIKLLKFGGKYDIIKMLR